MRVFGLLKVSLGLKVQAGVITAMCLTSQAFAEGGDSSSQAGDIGQAVAAVLVFALLMIGLGKWAWKPIIAQLRQREKSVASTITQAEKRREEAEEILAEYKQRLEDADREIQQLQVVAKEDSQLAHDNLLREARDEANKHFQQVKLAIEQARRDALGDLYDHTAEIATEMAGKIIGRNLDTSVHRKIVADSLAEIRSHINTSEAEK